MSNKLAGDFKFEGENRAQDTENIKKIRTSNFVQDVVHKKFRSNRFMKEVKFLAR